MVIYVYKMFELFTWNALVLVALVPSHRLVLDDLLCLEQELPEPGAAGQHM